MLYLLEGLCALCPHLPQNVNDLDSASTFFSLQSPKLVSQKKKEEMLFVCVIKACGPLFASSRATALIADSLASTPSPTHFAVAAAPEACYIQLQGSDWGPHCPVNILSVVKPRALSKLIVSELTASLQKGLNACSLIIWILVNWINYWIETVLLKMTKTQGQGEQRGINIVSVCSQAEDEEDTSVHGLARTHSKFGILYVAMSRSLPLNLRFCFTHMPEHTHTRTHSPTVHMWQKSKEWAPGKVQITIRTTEIRTKPIFKAENKCQFLFDARSLWLFPLLVF